MASQLRDRKVTKLDMYNHPRFTEAVTRDLWVHWSRLSKELVADEQDEAGLTAAQARYLDITLTNYRRRVACRGWVHRKVRSDYP